MTDLAPSPERKRALAADTWEIRVPLEMRRASPMVRAPIGRGCSPVFAITGRERADSTGAKARRAAEALASGAVDAAASRVQRNRATARSVARATRDASTPLREAANAQLFSGTEDVDAGISSQESAVVTPGSDASLAGCARPAADTSDPPTDSSRAVADSALRQRTSVPP